MTAPNHTRYSREAVVNAMKLGQQQNTAASILGCYRQAMPGLINYYGIAPDEWYSPEDEARPEMLIQGAMMVVQDVVTEWLKGFKDVSSEGLMRGDVQALLMTVDNAALGVETKNQTLQLAGLAETVYHCFFLAHTAGLPLSLAVAELHRSNMTAVADAEGAPSEGPDFIPPDYESILAEHRRDTRGQS